MKIWTWIKKVPLVGWIIAGIGAVIGIFAIKRNSQKRPLGSGTQVPGITPKEADRKRDEIRENHEAATNDIDEKYDSIEDAFADKFGKDPE